MVGIQVIRSRGEELSNNLIILFPCLAPDVDVGDYETEMTDEGNMRMIPLYWYHYISQEYIPITCYLAVIASTILRQTQTHWQGNCINIKHVLPLGKMTVELLQAVTIF